MSKKRRPKLGGVGAGLGLAQTIGATNHNLGDGAICGVGDISNPNQAPATL